MGSFKGKGLPKFINESEVATDFDQEESTTEEPTDQMETGSMENEGEDGPQPEIIKVYSESEEDIQELTDAGIELEDGLLPEDSFYIKVKTLEGTEEILLFVEKDPTSRVPVTDEEGEEGMESEEGDMPAEDETVTESEMPMTDEDDEMPVEGGEMPVEGAEEAPKDGRFDTEFVAQHGDNEYVITAEIEVSAEGEVEDMDVDQDEPVEVQEPGADEDGEGMATEEDEEAPVTESHRILGFNDFINLKS